MTPDDTDERRSTRVYREEPIEVTVLSCPAESSLEGRTLHCSSVDASASGLRLRFGPAVPDAAVLELEVGIAGRKEKCRLCGVVRWSRPTGDGDTSFVGIELQNLSPPRERGLAALTSIFGRKRRRAAERLARDDLAAWRDYIFQSIRFRDS